MVGNRLRLKPTKKGAPHEREEVPALHELADQEGAVPRVEGEGQADDEGVAPHARHHLALRPVAVVLCVWQREIG
jgi:hypothetical protein